MEGGGRRKCLRKKEFFFVPRRDATAQGTLMPFIFVLYNEIWHFSEYLNSVCLEASSV